MSERDLPVNRLSTTDAEGGRLYVYPADVRGKFRKWRGVLSIFLIALFLYLPWIKINGHQALWLDVVGRKFSIFGLLFWAHDAPMLLFVLGGSALVLFFVTAVWGRVWCGWACPQTVFVEQIFRRVERWIEGDAVKRRQRDAGSWTFDKLWRRTAKWTAYLAVSLVISHSFLAYFVGVDALRGMMVESPAAHVSTFVLMAVMTAIVLFDFGWFREQFCTIACPYGRFQSVLMDRKSMVVAYDTARGEPRRGVQSETGRQGDCVNCYRCVQVCPTGIDIRRGVQMECVACTACIDACDEVMKRTKRPLGLIRYDSEEALSLGAPLAAGATNVAPKFRPSYGVRAVIYGVLISLAIGGLAYRVNTRAVVEWTAIRAVGVPYQLISEQGEPLVLNHYRLDLHNQSFEKVEWVLDIPSSEGDRGVRLTTAEGSGQLEPGAGRRISIFVKFPAILLDEFGRAKAILRIRVKDSTTLEKEESQEVNLLGPLG